MKPVALITGGGGALAGAVREELEGQGWLVHAPTHAQMDVAVPDQVEATFAALDRLDLLVHNAGITRDVTLAKMEAEQFDAVMEVHLRGGFLCSRAALKLMSRQRQGHLIFIGSFSAYRGPVGQSNYAAAKAGLIGLTQSIAAEYGSRNVRANCVMPGFLETGMTKPMLEVESSKQKVLATHTLGRLNTCRDAARFIAFLHTMEHVSGQIFQLDSRIRRWA